MAWPALPCGPRGDWGLSVPSAGPGWACPPQWGLVPVTGGSHHAQDNVLIGILRMDQLSLPQTHPGAVLPPAFGVVQTRVTMPGWTSVPPSTARPGVTPKPGGHLPWGLSHAGGAWVSDLERFGNSVQFPEPGTGCLCEPRPSPSCLEFW